MSTIKRINPEREMRFYGTRTILSDSPDLVSLALSTGLPQLRYATYPITEETIFAPEDANVLLRYIAENDWRIDFEKNLQSLACTEKGENLLTGWFSFDQFLAFVAGSNAEPLVQNILDKLAASVADWKKIGIEDVFFDGFDLGDRASWY